MSRIESLITGVCLYSLIGAGLPLKLSAQATPGDITGASLEDLMNIQVTSVSKREQSLSKTGGAVFVITQEDIHHSGATNIPDLLRMVPGLSVARVNANTWAISIRGFNNRYSDKVLVLVDGRSVYNPITSGVDWDQQRIPIENIDRIEVIRGPGGSIWGANAMNGVINVITKNTEDTLGGLVAATAGSDEQAGLIQYGDSIGTKGAWRVYGNYRLNQTSPSPSSSPGVDNGHTSQIGFRSDWNLSPHDKLTVQGDMSGASEGQTVTTLFSSRLPDYYHFDDTVRLSAANLLGRWSHVYANGSDTTLQVYYDRFSRFDQGLDVQSTGDFDFQYHFHAGARNNIVAGVGYRLTDQSFGNGYEVSLGMGTRRDSLFSSFIQDEIAITPSLALTIGMKLEHNAYTGYESEPSIQLVYTPDKKKTLWASASRAIQQPSWVYSDAQVDAAAFPLQGGGFAVYQLVGNPKSTAPLVYTYEVGYRAAVSKKVTFDLTGFVSDYDELPTLESGAPYFTAQPAPAHLVLPTVFGNFGKSTTYGIELSAHWNVTDWWRISPGYSFLQMDFSLDPRSNDTTLTATFEDSPKHQAQLRSNVRLHRNVQWDTSVYYVGALATGPVPAYTRMDTRIGWHPFEAIEISLTGQNLLTARHFEFMDARAVTPTQVARDVVAQMTWRF